LKIYKNNTIYIYLKCIINYYLLLITYLRLRDLPPAIDIERLRVLPPVKLAGVKAGIAPPFLDLPISPLRLLASLKACLKL
jgi:hypothetical protein